MSRIQPLTAVIFVTVVFTVLSCYDRIVNNFQEPTPMTFIDPLVLREFESTDATSVSVLIVCDELCSSVVSALQREGIVVTNTGSAELGSVGASITRSQLEKLKYIPGISAVELDQKVEILESN